MKITKILNRNYLYNKELIEKYCVLFFEIDSGNWIKFVIDDGVLFLEKVKDIKSEEYSGDDEFNYPIEEYNIKEDWGNIISINEYKYKEINGESSGFLFVLENKVMSYVDYKDKLEFIEDIKKELLRDHIIKPIDNWEKILA